MNKTAIISGVKGQDGSYLADILLEKGYEVVGLTRDPGLVFNANISHLEDKIELVYTSYDYHSILDIVEKYQPDEIYNLTGQPYVLKSWEMIDETILGSGLIPCHFLKAVNEVNSKIKLFQASSSEIFEPSDNGLTEKSNILPRTPYGCAKAMAHNMVASFRENYGIYAVNGILFNHESPRRGENFLSLKVVREAVKIKNGESNKIVLGNLNVKRDWGYAPDYMEASYLSLQQDNPEDYIISTGVVHSVEDMVRIVFNSIGLDHKEYLEVNKSFIRPFEPQVTKGIPDKAKNILNWEAKVSFEEMLKILIKKELEKRNLNYEII